MEARSSLGPHNVFSSIQISVVSQ